VKFALSNFPQGYLPQPSGIESLQLSLADKWILTRLSKLIKSTNSNYENYKFGEMVNGLYDFWYKELADVYLEGIKPIMRGDDENAKIGTRNTLFICLDYGLKMLHPTMPYLTEELYQRLPHLQEQKSESICIAAFPQELASFEQEGVED